MAPRPIVTQNPVRTSASTVVTVTTMPQAQEVVAPMHDSRAYARTQSLPLDWPSTEHDYLITRSLPLSSQMPLTFPQIAGNAVDPFIGTSMV